jgi:hypothetical protein
MFLCLCLCLCLFCFVLFAVSWVNEGIDPMIRGSAAQLQQEVDLFYVPDVRSFLFGLPGTGGVDLAVLSIERGRDHGKLRMFILFQYLFCFLFLYCFSLWHDECNHLFVV